ncbi:tRNA 2-thiouridine(34) synthase MnmA [Actinomyces vulturis]|uniref:tRNA 2-thiouridine(34) synthase MnmA n=1 Tax=Actinomyces vulturis TaxID=1857645 RepID=UPI0008356F02|nr:tRNA 2-thiouridine(34) synthase MnmA [Actinomyces vulturis]
MRVLAALSGGVDSAVAAARAVEAGHEVVGVHMALSRNRAQSRSGSRGCCSIEDASDARRAADILDIPFYVWDLSEEFEQRVITDFLAEYKAGRTPNPCVRCNERVKFDALLERGLAMGFDAVATGHYARIHGGAADGRPGDAASVRLSRAADKAKDQSYVLAVSGSEALSRALFPLGDVPSKDEVRKEASRRNLPVASKPDSYDICFVADGDTRGFLRNALGSQPGNIVTPEGDVLGEHNGYFGYTVGQRKGLGLTVPAEDGQPRYVLATRPETNEVVVGPAALLSRTRLDGTHIHMLAPYPESGQWDDVHVQVRAHGRALPATVKLSDSIGGKSQDKTSDTASNTPENAPAHTVDISMEVTLYEPLRGVAAGQSVVVYDQDNETVLAEATLEIPNV